MTVLRLDAMDEYDIISQIGQGTFSAVYQVQHKATHRAYAMKVLKSKCPSIEQAEHNEELQFMEALGFHPNVIVLHDAIFEASVGRLSFFIDLMDQSLADLLQDRRESLPINEALLLIYQLLSALEHVHEAGLIHRDVKPENCFINPQKLELRLGDFGSARRYDDTGQFTEYVATRWYRPPECLITTGVYGPPMDIWAAGCIFAELILGRPLFPGKNALDQLNRIHRLLGTPSSTVIKRVCTSDKLKDIEFMRFPAQRLENTFQGVAPEVIDLLQRLLTYVPSDRITAEDALRHPAFQLVTHQGRIAKTSVQVASTPGVDCIGLPAAVQAQDPTLAPRVRDDIGLIKAHPRRGCVKLPPIVVPRNAAVPPKAQQRRVLLTTPPKHSGPPPPQQERGPGTMPSNVGKFGMPLVPGVGGRPSSKVIIAPNLGGSRVKIDPHHH